MTEEPPIKILMTIENWKMRKERKLGNGYK